MSEPVDVFAHVIGHERTLGLLRREVAEPANTYLFAGPTGVGKATVARAFAAALLCPDGADHDGECRSCRRAGSGNHPDLVSVEPEGRQSLGVDQARATIRQASLSPVESGRRVFLFEEADAMTEQAANALLKTLEEPGRTTVFILVSESIDALPSTVGSRCRTVQFGRVPEDTLASALLARGIDADRADGLARLSGGRPGLAFSLVDNPEIAGFRAAWLSVPNRVTDRPGEAFVLAQEMVASVDPLLEGVGADMPEEQAKRERRRARQALLDTGLEILASWYVDAAAIQVGGTVRNRDQPTALLTAVPPRMAVANAERITDAIADLQANLRPQLLLADLFADL
jgi:DNA polymerase III delta' subunit